MLRYAILSLISIALVSCDMDDLECGTGTKEVDGKCVAIEDDKGQDQNHYQDFTPVTRSVQPDDYWPFNVSITDLTGNIACSLSEGFTNQPGLAGSQVFGSFPNSYYQKCPVGTYGVDSSECQNSGGSDDEVWESCARYRRFDTSGKVVANLLATAGAITVTANVDNCTYELSLVFPGGKTFSDTFTVYVPPMEGGPYCTAQDR